MNDSNYIFLVLIPLVAFLYSSVGHGGASGYLALMVFFGISPVLMKPSALILNIFVSGIAFIHYYANGYFKWKILVPFIILSIPMSFIGAKINLDTDVYNVILAICLLIAIIRIFGFSKKDSEMELKHLPFLPALIIGGLIGFISGIIGIGGGLLLSPILILLNWANMKQTAAVSAAFILLNSISGLIGASLASQFLSSELYLWTALAIAGGMVGAWFGSKRFNIATLKYILAFVMLLACFKLAIN